MKRLILIAWLILGAWEIPSARAQSSAPACDPQNIPPEMRGIYKKCAIVNSSASLDQAISTATEALYVLIDEMLTSSLTLPINSATFSQKGSPGLSYSVFLDGSKVQNYDKTMPISGAVTLTTPGTPNVLITSNTDVEIEFGMKGFGLLFNGGEISTSGFKKVSLTEIKVIPIGAQNHNKTLHILNAGEVDIVNSLFNATSTYHDPVSSLDLEQIGTVNIVNSSISGGSGDPAVIPQVYPLKLLGVTNISINSTSFSNEKCLGFTSAIQDGEILQSSPSYYKLTPYQLAKSDAPKFVNGPIKAKGTLCGTTTIPGQYIEVFETKVTPRVVDCQLNEVWILGEVGSTMADQDGNWCLTKLNEGYSLVSEMIYAATGTIDGQTSYFSDLYKFTCPGISFDPLSVCAGTSTSTPLANVVLKNGYSGQLRSLNSDALSGTGTEYAVQSQYVNGPLQLDYYFPQGYAIPYHASCQPLVTGTIASYQAGSILGMPTYICAGTTDPYPLVVSPSGGQLTGPGIVGLKIDPASPSLGSGTKTYTYHLANSPCPDVTAQTFVYAAPVKLNNVLSASATTLSDNWPLDQLHTGGSLDTFVTRSNSDFFGTGHKGIWRAEEGYAYVADRKQWLDDKQNVRLTSDRTFTSATTTDPLQLDPLQTSGTMDNVPMFDWSNPDNGNCFPKWRKMSMVTRYHPIAGELEDQDVIKRYSAALYGYRQKMDLHHPDRVSALGLVTAQVANASQSEIAFEGFEEYDMTTVAKFSDLATSNWTFFTGPPSDNATLYQEYPIYSANGQTAQLGISPRYDLVGKQVKLFGANINKTKGQTEVTCYNEKNVFGSFKVHTVDPDPEGKLNVSQVKLGTLDNSDFPVTGFWRGKMSVETPVPKGVVTNEGTVQIAKGKAHTGSQSLSLTGNVAWQQVYLTLQPGKIYVLSTWVSTQKLAASYQSAATNPTASKRGLYMEFLSEGSTVGTSPLLEPTGNVIEGWQKIEGTFTMPATAKTGVLHIQVPDGQTDYYDDLRLLPLNGVMQSNVYRLPDLKLSAVLDNNNYASFYYYDQEGHLFLVKKETEKGVKTIQESFSHQNEKH